MRQKEIKGFVSCALASCLLLLGGCEKVDIHEIKPIPKEIYQKTIAESTVVSRVDMQPVIRLKLTQNSLRYYNYSIDIENLEFSELRVSNGDFVKEGQVLVVFKSEKIEKQI